MWDVKQKAPNGQTKPTNRPKPRRHTQQGGGPQGEDGEGEGGADGDGGSSDGAASTQPRARATCPGAVPWELAPPY